MIYSISELEEMITEKDASLEMVLKLLKLMADFNLKDESIDYIKLGGLIVTD